MRFRQFFLATLLVILGATLAHRSRSEPADTERSGRSEPGVSHRDAAPRPSIPRVEEVEVVATASVAPAEAEPVDAAPSPLKISLGRCHHPGCGVSLAFSRPMVPPDRLLEAPAPDVLFDPPLRGSWTWRSPTQAGFQPDAGALNWGMRVGLTLSSAIPDGEEASALEGPWKATLTVPFLQIAGKVASWPVVEGEPRVLAPLNGGSRRLGRGALVLLFDQPVEIATIQEHLSATDADGQPLELEVARPTGLRHVSMDGIQESHLAAVRLKELPADGEPVLFDMPWSGTVPADADHGALGEEFFVDTEFHVIRHELVSSSRRGRGGRTKDRVPLSTSLHLEFSDPFRIALLQEAIRVEPEPRSMYVYGSSSREASVRLELDPGTRYRLKAGSEFRDMLGNPLESVLDVRFHTEDLEPQLTLPTEALLLERRRPLVPARGRNIGAPEVRVWPFESAGSFMKALSLMKSQRHQRCAEYGLGGRGRQIDFGGVSAKLNVGQPFSVTLGDASGLLCVELRARARGSRAAGPVRAAVLVQSSDLAVTTKAFDDSLLVWLTRLGDASVVPGGTVQVFGASGTRIASGTTDAAGIVILDTPGLVTGASLKAPLFVVARAKDVSGATDVAVAPVSNDRLSQAWHFGLPGRVEGVEALRAAVFTERGVYRPGDRVHGKIIVAGASDAPSSDGHRVRVEVHDPRGQRLVTRALELDRFGTAAFDVPLGDQAAVGAYSLRVRSGERVAQRQFRVEEYRVPTFKVDLASAPRWDQGGDVGTTIQARYHHGGELVGRDVKWRVVRTSQPFSPEGFPGFVFHRDGSRSSETVEQGEAKLDTKGRVEMRFTPERRGELGPARYTVDATVTDVDRQAYSGRLSRVVHPSAFYLGLGRPPVKVVAAGRPLTVPVVALDPEGEALAGIAVRLRVENLAHHTTARLQSTSGNPRVERLDHTVTENEQECRIETKMVPVECVLRLGRPGAYRIVATARDGELNPVTTSFELTSTGGRPAPWPRFGHERIAVVADRDLYRPGDVARLVIQSPFPAARALLTVERDTVVESRLIEIRGDTPAIELPITDDYAPNVFVSVVLVRGRVHDERDATGFETGAPGFRLGYAALRVEPTRRLVDVQIESPSLGEPGATLPVRLLARDHLGQPVSGQATLMIVDEAVLGLTSYHTPRPGDQIYAPRPLGVRTAESRLELPHSRRERHEQLFPGGDGGGGDLLAPLPDQLRNLFESTAYWNPDVRLDEDGTAEVNVELPDNVTTFRIMAVVTDVETRVGSSHARVVVRKPLMVQPLLPRFVYPEDRLRIEGLAFNGTEADGRVQLAVELEGLERIPGAEVDAQSIPTGGSRSFPFDVRVTSRDSVRVRFHATLGAHSDSVEVEIPVLSPGTRRTLVTSTTVTGEETLELMIPGERLSGTTQVDLVASTTALSELEGAVDYLMRYPNGCIEQTTSTAYPLVTLKDLLPEIGVTVDEEKLEEYTTAGLKRILSFQTTSGGLSYWPGKNQPHAFATAFGLTALIEAKKQGYDIPDEALRRMADYLEAVLSEGTITGEMPHGGMADGDTRALFVMTLGRLGRPQPAYLETLWDKRGELSPFGLSFLAIAATEMDSAHPLVEPLLASIADTARQSSDEAWFEGERSGGWSFDSPLRTHASALIAFAVDKRSGAMGGKLLQGLLNRRQYGMWGNTQENVFGIMGVHALTRSERVGAGPAMRLEIDGRTVDSDRFEEASARVRRLRLSERDLSLREGEGRSVRATLERQSGPPIILTLRAQYDAPLTAETRAPRSNGFAIERRYETLDGKSLEDQTDGARVIPLGSLVRVRLRVTTDDPRNYVAIADKLPAGLEPLNTRLDTTESIAVANLGDDFERSLSFLSHSEMRDERVAFYIDEMPAGVYELAYVARATTPGRFLRPAADVEAMYEPEVQATTAIDTVRVR